MLTITKGEKFTGEIKLRDLNGDPYDVSSFTKIKVCIPKQSGDGLTVSEAVNGNGSVASFITGKTYTGINLVLGKDDTAQLYPYDRVHIDVELDNDTGTATKRQRFDNAASVVDSCIS